MNNPLTSMEGFVAQIVLGIIVIVLATQSFVIVRQQSSAVIERLGKFNRVIGAGWRFKLPIVERVAGRVNLRIDQLMVDVETKTEDNVFVKMPIAVQHVIKPESVREAFYKLADPKGQIRAYVLDVVRGKVPELKLDDLFKSKDDVAKAVKDNLKEKMSDFGYDILEALVTDIEPEAGVKKSMNEINEAQRQRTAAAERGEAEKTLKVKAAEAEAEAMRLHGKGVADQRAAITEGLKRSVEELTKAAPELDATEVMATIVLTQYLDTMRDIADHSQTRTIFFPHSPGAVQDLWKQISMGNLATGNGDGGHGAENGKVESGKKEATVKPMVAGKSA